MALPEVVYTQRFRLWLHIGQIILLVLAAILTIARLSIKGNVASRAQVMVIVFAIKSLIFIAYQLSTHYSARFTRFASPKANFILNAIDILFWFTATILTIMGISSRCVGSACGVSWVLLLVVMIVTASMGLASWVCWKDWRAVKYGGRGRVIPEVGGAKYYGEQSA